MRKIEEKYPTKRYVKFEKLVREKMEGGYYHMPEKVTSPEMAYDTIISLTHCDMEAQEVFGVLMFNTKNKVIGCEILTRGSANACIVTPREVFKMALMRGAVSVMVFHNHPSGDPYPSAEDIKVTERLSDCGDLLGIKLLDHIIVGDDSWTSLSERGRMNG